MGMVHRELVAVQGDAEARAVTRFDAGAEVAQQRLDFAPLNIAADRVVEDCLQDVAVLVAHGRPLVDRDPATIHQPDAGRLVHFRLRPMDAILAVIPGLTRDPEAAADWIPAPDRSPG